MLLILIWMALLPESVAPSQLIDVPVTLFEMSAQVAPPLTEPSSDSPATSAALSVPVIVCAATLVMKSVATPESAEMSIVLIEVVGVSITLLTAMLKTPLLVEPSALEASTVMEWLVAVSKSSSVPLATVTTPVVLLIAKRPPALSVKL